MITIPRAACVGLQYEAGWDVEIKLRKGGSSAGTSDVVRGCLQRDVSMSDQSLGRERIGLMCCGVCVAVLLLSDWEAFPIQDRGT